MFRRGSHGRCDECGRSYGRGHLGRHDGRDRSIMTARRLYSLYSAGTEASHEWAVVSLGSARVGENLADTAGLMLEGEGPRLPL
jgi:hypothetical protein